jgi:hypothetical protein
MMQKISSPQEIAELELALQKSRQVPGFRALLAFFWGLILAKCLLAQWLSEIYHTPINTFWFVWVPSFMISGALTLGYAYWLFRELPRMPLSGRLVSATWVACATGFGILVLVAGVYGVFSPYLLPALAAVLLGVGFSIHGVVDRRNIFRYAAIGWWLAAIWLAANPDITSLAWMALFLALFEVLPAGWLFFTRKRAA